MKDGSNQAKTAAACPTSPFLNTRQAAYYLRISARHLERLRKGEGGPYFRRHGRFVFYHIDDLDAWSRASSGRGKHGA